MNCSFSILFLFFSFLMPAYGQEQVIQDSLLTELKFSSTENEKMEVLISIANYYMSFDYSKALEYARQGIEIASEHENDEMLVRFYHMAGNISFNIGNYKAALEDFHNTLSISNSIGYTRGKLSSLVNMGAIYDRLSNYDKAIENYMHALNLINESNEAGDTIELNTLVHIYNNIASAYEALGKKQEAIQYFEKGIEIAKEIDNKDGLAFIYNNLGKLYNELGKDEKARDFLNEAITLRIKQNDLKSLSKSYAFLAVYYFNQNQHDSAIWAANECLSYARQVGAVLPQGEAFETLHSIYKSQGKYKEALEAFENFKVISDSLLTRQKVSEISNLEANFQIAEYEKETEIQKQKIRSKYTIFVIVLGGLSFSAILLLFLARSQTKRVKLEKQNLEYEVELKNKELATNVMYLVQKNKLINKMASKLLTLKENMKEINKKEVQYIISDLQSEVDNKVWEEFEIRFQQVHNDFYDSLRAKHPDLTPSEERLCALLRLNLTTKEIAAINHQSIRGIEVTRGRLRKKLNLTGTDTNLISYLEQF